VGEAPAPANRRFFPANAYGATFWDCLHGNICRRLAQDANARRRSAVFNGFFAG
jgi:hypothetical protein